MSGAEIRVRGVTRVYETAGQRIDALRSIELDIDPGEAIAIVGGSGSGKSTLLSLLGAMDQPTAGTITVDGTDIVKLPVNARARHRRRVGFVFQAYHLLPGLSALENVVAPVVPFEKPRHSRPAPPPCSSGWASAGENDQCPASCQVDSSSASPSLGL